MDNLTTLQKQREFIERQIIELEGIIKNLPDESICARKSKNGEYFYTRKIVLPSGEKKEVFVKKDNVKEVALAAQKKYDENKLRDLYVRKDLLTDMIKLQSMESFADNYLKKHPGIAQLLINREYDNERVNQWKNADYRRSWKYPENIKYSTVIPELHVRSKSEADIVGMLVSYDVPFHYDEIVVINNIELAVDFICMNARTGQIWYWDHRGRLDDAGYINLCLNRESLYLHAGMIPWVNMIVTTETKNNPLDIQWVDNIIRYYLL